MANGWRLEPISAARADTGCGAEGFKEIISRIIGNEAFSRLRWVRPCRGLMQGLVAFVCFHIVAVRFDALHHITVHANGCRFESGVHRVQRVPSTESKGRVHTSTASVAVMPEPTEVDRHISPADLRIGERNRVETRLRVRVHRR